MSFQLTILGSSGALPAFNRFPSSQYLTIQNRHFLIDCGEGTQMQMMRFGISLHKITHIFISHLHGDHYLGLMGLIFSMHLQRRDADLHIFAFSGLDEILTAQLKHSRSVLNFKIVFHRLNETHEIVHEDEVLSVSTIPLDHKVPTCGFLFREKTKSLRFDKSKLAEGILPVYIVQLKNGKDVVDESGKVLYRSSDFTLPARKAFSYAYCSDTQPSEAVIEYIRNVDLLYHEATFLEDEEVKARMTKHSTASEAAKAAKKANVGQLLIGHFSARYKDLTPVLSEAKMVFDETTLAIEGEIFELHD